MICFNLMFMIFDSEVVTQSANVGNLEIEFHQITNSFAEK